MRARLLFAVLFIVCCISFFAIAQDYQAVEGVVKEIADDGSYIRIGPTKVLASKELIADNYLKVGDEVLVETIETDGGLEAVFIDFLNDE